MGARRHHSGQTYDTPRGLRGDVGAMFCGEPCMGGGGYGPRLPLAADWDGVLRLLFCVFLACGVGGYFVAFALIANAMYKLSVVIADWRAALAEWDDLIEFAAEWVWCFECEVYGFAA